jgi:hypothetical protein
MAVETRPVQGFDGIELRGIGNLHVTQGAVEEFRVEADSETMPSIVTDVEGGRLIVRVRFWDALLALRPLGRIDLYVVVKDLRELLIAGSGSAEIGPLTTERMTATITGAGSVSIGLHAKELRCVTSGSGDFRIAGKVDRQEVVINGTGDYRAPDVESIECNVTISGSGSASVRVSERLDVTISGAGRVEYAGDPKVSQRIAGSGHIVKAG